MDIDDLARKVKALADRTDCPGEKASAEAALQRLVEKYGLTVDSIDQDAVKKQTLWFQGPWERMLLLQVIYKVLNTKAFRTWRVRAAGTTRFARNRLLLECTDVQRVEIEVLFVFYRDLYLEDLKIFQQAFIQKHNLFGELTNEERDEQLNREPSFSREELFKMNIFESGMTDKVPTPLLQAGE